MAFDLVENFCPIYQNVLRKVLISMEFAENKLEKEELFEEFSQKHFLLPQFWRKFVDPIESRFYLQNIPEKTDTKKIFRYFFIQFHKASTSKTKTVEWYPNIDINVLQTSEDYEKSIKFIEKTFDFPHNRIESFYQAYSNFGSKPVTLKMNKNYEKNLSLLKQFQKAGDDDKKWLKCLKQLENEESVIANIELRLGSKKSCTNKDIWKYYIEYLRDRNPIAMLEVYLRYCRFFISDIEMVKKYRNEIERIGKLEAVSVFWIDTIEWELEFGDLKTAQSLLKEAVKDLTDIPKVLSEENFMKVFGKCKRKMKESDEENFDVPSKRRRIQTPSSVEDEDDGNEEDKNEEKVVKKYVDDYEEQDSDEEEEEEYEDESDEDEENEGDESDESEDDSEKSEKILKRRVRISSSEDDVSDSRNEKHQSLPTIKPEKCFFTKCKSYQSFSIPSFMAKYITNNANSSLLSKLHQSSKYFYSLCSISICHRLVLRNFVEPRNFEYSLFHTDTEMNFFGDQKIYLLNSLAFCAYGILTNFSRFISKLFKCEATHMS